MKLSRLALVCSILVCPAWAAEDPRVRRLDPAVALAYEAGYRESSTFRALVAELHASDLIVHVVSSVALPSGVGGTTRFVGTIGGSRYVRIDLASSLTYRSRTAVLGRELHHACEIARSGAASSRAVEALFRVIGRASPVAPGGFETLEAEAAGRLVLAELIAGRGRARSTEQ
jgi:hypothetical protein